MIALSNAKINLGLKVLRKRPDNFHDLETIFYPIPFYDILEIIKLKNTFPSLPKDFEQITNARSKIVEIRPGISLHLAFSGIPIEGEVNNNLCVRAFRAFDQKHPVHHHYFLHLHKTVPAGAGLGGGSSNASFTLQLLNQLEGYPFSADELLIMASGLGSDCAFFVINKPSFASGKGEVLTPIKLDLKGYYLVVVIPPVHVNTAQAFEGIQPVESRGKLNLAINKPLAEWHGLLENDFEKTIFQEKPIIAAIKNQMIAAGAVYASMSGSGSAVYGLFREPMQMSQSFPGCSYFEKHLCKF